MTPITEPGIYDIPADTYHQDPVEGGSLSSSGARQLLPPSCPARFRHDQDHGTEDHRPHFDFGHAAHKMVLGDGPELVQIDADSWRTKAAKTERDEAHANGAVPLLADDYSTVIDMAAAIAAHPVASSLFRPGAGKPEQTLVWRDDRAPVWRRARLDWLPDTRGGRLIVPDYKTCHSADPEALSRSAHQFGYHCQADWYLAGCRALGLADDHAVFVFVAQEKTPPYLVTIFEFDHVAMRIGAARNRRSIDVYAHCTDTGVWPAYTDGVHQMPLPRWAEIAEGEHLA